MKLDALEAKQTELGTSLASAMHEYAERAQALASIQTALEKQMLIERKRTNRLYTTSFPNRANFLRFNRVISEETAKELSEKWSKLLDLEIEPKAIHYMAHKACIVEDDLTGRLATEIEDAVLRSLVVRAVKAQTVSLLEIGTLFGVGAAIIHRLNVDHFDEVKMTLIDPLDGYYGENKRDILTGEPITEAVLRRNLDRIGASTSTTIIKALSTDVAALEQTATAQFDVFIIDGDHSYAGVKADFDLYHHVVKPGGYLIVDDYDTVAWPDVKAFVDSELLPREDFTMIGHSSRTAVFRKVA